MNPEALAEILQNHRLVAGVDEAGRGPLAGPVVAAAVILDPHQPLGGLRDSKKLSAARRESLYEQIHATALAVGTGRVEAGEIDRINILQASLLAMRRAVESLQPAPEIVLVDGNTLPVLPYPALAVVRGDSLVQAISAASIIAKVTRDREMCELDNRYPGYDLAGNKGYPTAAHIEAIRNIGVSPIHRRSFRPVRDHVAGQ